MKWVLLAVWLLASAAQASPPFRVYQFVPRGAAASKMQCQPRRLESLAFADWDKMRWVTPRGLKLLGKECTADAAELIAAKAGLAIAAIRVSEEPPRAALLDLSPKTPPSTPGWPSPIVRRRLGSDLLKPAPRGDASMLRLAAVCWPSVDAWPVPQDRAGENSHASLEPKNQCEWWLLPFKQAKGGSDLEPDLDGRSFLVIANSRDAWDGQFNARLHWPQLFSDPTLNIQEALEAGWDKVPTANEGSLWASSGSMNAGAAAKAAPGQSSTAQVRSGILPACAGEVAQTHEAVFARFASWADRFGVSESKDPAWSPARGEGRCGAYEVLRSALEETLACKLEAGACAR